MNFLVRKIFGAYRGEESRVVLLFVFGLTVGLFLSSFYLGATTLFLGNYDISMLAEALMLSGIVGFCLSIIYSYLNIRIAFAKLSIMFFFLFASAFLSIYYYYELERDEGIIKLAFILVIPVTTVIQMIFRALYNALFDIRQAKRLGRRIDLGIVVSSASFLFSAHWLLQNFFIHIDRFIFISGLSGFLCLIIFGIVILQFSSLNELQVSAQYIGYNNNLIKLIKNKYFLLLGLFVVFSSISLVCIDFTFLKVVEDQYSQAQNGLFQMANFLAMTGGAVVIAAFIVQAFVSRWALQQYGMKTTLLVLPFLLFLVLGIAFGVGKYFGSTSASKTFFLFFIIVIAGKIVTDVLKKGLQDQVFKFYFLPINSRLRFDIQAKVEGPVSGFAFSLGGAMLMAISHWHLMDFLYYPFVIVGVIVFWVIVTFKIHSEYRELLEESLDQQQDLIKHEKAFSDSYIMQLSRSIPDIDHKLVTRHLYVLSILEPIHYKKLLIQLLDNENDKIQEVVLKQASELCLLDAIPVLEKIMASKYYPVLRTSELIRKVYNQLRGAEFRLEKIKYIEQLTLSKLTNERIYGALLTTYADEEMKGKLLNKLFRDPSIEVRYHAITAAAGSDNLELHNNLIEKLNSSAYSNASMSAISATGEILFHMLETAFYLSGQSQKTQIRIVQIYGRVGSEKAVELLIKKLNYPNQNVVAAVLEALSKCGYTLDDAKSLQIRTELEEVCNTAIWNMSALIDLQREGSSDLLYNAMEREIDNNFENIFRLLALIYDPKSVELVKTNINSGNVEEAEFASELLDVFISDEMKPMLIPILNITPYEEKVDRLMFLFPTEPMKKKEVLVNLVQRDYKWVNRWTKACALKELSQDAGVNEQDLFAANIVNPDSIMRETATEAIYNFYKDNLDGYYERFKDQINYIITSDTIEKVIREHSQNKREFPVMKFDVISYLNKVKEFSGVSGLVLSEIAKSMKVLEFKVGEVVDQYSSVNLMDYFVVFEGSVALYKNEIHIADYAQQNFVHNLDWLNERETGLTIKANEDSIVFRIKREDLNELMSFNEEIPKSILDSMTKKVKTFEESQMMFA